MKLFLTKKLHFSASHRLYNPNFSDEKNDEVFGLCNNFYGHGHNYEIEVTICGEIDKETGYVFDLKKMKEIITNEIILKVDHKHLNFDVDFLKGVIPTVENLVMKFWEILEDKFLPCKLYSIKLYETPNSYVTYFGE